MLIFQEQDENVLVPERVHVALENDDLCRLLFDVDATSLTVDIVVGRLHAGRAFSRSTDPEMKFLARHFSKVSDDVLATLLYAIFAEVLEQSRLRLRSEDWLYGLVSRLGRATSICSSLSPSSSCWAR
jgi:hypothetical protein